MIHPSPVAVAGSPLRSAAGAVLLFPESHDVTGETLVCGGGWRG